MFLLYFALLPVLIGCTSVYLVSMVDPSRLLSIGPTDFVRALPLVLLCQMIGLLLVSCGFTFTTVKSRTILFTAMFWLRLTVGGTLAFTLEYDDERIMHDAAAACTVLLETGQACILLPMYQKGLSWLYYLFGTNILVGKIVNSLLGAICPFLVYDLANAAFPNRRTITHGSLYLAGFLPPLVIYSGLNLKESASAFLITAALWCLQAAPWKFRWRFSGGLLSCLALFYLRGGWVIFPALGIGVYLLGQSMHIVQRKKLRLSHLVATMLVGSAFAVGVWFIGSGVKTYAQVVLSGEYGFRTFQLAASTSTVGVLLDKDEAFTTRNIVVLLVRSLVAPSPFRFIFDRGVDVVIEALIMACWYGLFPFAMVGLIVGRNNPNVLSWGISAAAVYSFAAIGMTFGGHALRHRIAMFPLFYLLSAAGWKERLRFRFLIGGIWFCILMGFYAHVFSRM